MTSAIRHCQPCGLPPRQIAVDRFHQAPAGAAPPRRRRTRPSPPRAICPRDERLDTRLLLFEFSPGPIALNAVAASCHNSPAGHRTKLDLTACYPEKPALQSVHRTVCLSGREYIVVADEIRGQNIESITYNWHGHPEAAWHARDNWLLLHLPEDGLWFTSPQAQLGTPNIHCREGSRGQLTAAASVQPAAVPWWVFAFGETPPRAELAADARAIQVANHAFKL